MKTLTKRQKVLEAFLRGEKHTRFSAERKLNDHCLPSTVSDLQRLLGVVISRKFITIRGYRGSPTICCLYWIEPDEVAKYISRKAKAPRNGDQPNRGHSNVQT